jgi:hypothetical protein
MPNLPRPSPCFESRRAARRCQCGQATTEFVVVCLALVPIFFLFPLVLKYLDLFRTTEEASRYVAFESTVHLPGTPQTKSDEQMSQEVARRFFSNTEAQIRTGEKPIDDTAHRLPLWSDNRGHALINDFKKSVSATSKVEDFNWHAPTRFVWHDQMNLPEKNLVTGSVTVKPDNLPGLRYFDKLDLQVTRKTAVLVDAWSGRDEQAAKDVVQRMDILYSRKLAKPLETLADALEDLFGDPHIQTELQDEDWAHLPCDRVRHKDGSKTCR